MPRFLDKSSQNGTRKGLIRGKRMDETYVKIKGKWYYLYRAVDKCGNTVDFLLTKFRDAHAARFFFTKAIRSSERPTTVTIDKSGANKAALNSINNTLPHKLKIKLRQCKYLNNIVEQDHRFIKHISKPTKGFKSFCSAYATLVGVELHHMLRKGQHKNSKTKSVFEQFYALAA